MTARQSNNRDEILKQIIKKNLKEVLKQQTGDLEYNHVSGAAPENDAYQLGEENEEIENS